MPSPRLRSSSCSSCAERKSSRFSSSAEIAARCLVERRPGSVPRRFPVTLVLGGVGHGGDDDVGQVVIDQAVQHFAA